MLSSAMRAIPLHQDPAPLIVGERVNSQGSRKIKQLLLEDDYDGILAVARDQVEGGAHLLDVCVALTERPDEAAQMQAVVKKLQMSVETPLMIDSTEAEVIKAALESESGPRHHQLDQPGKRAPALRGRAAAGRGARRGGDRADHRRERHGENGRQRNWTWRGASTTSP